MADLVGSGAGPGDVAGPAREDPCMACARLQQRLGVDAGPAEGAAGRVPLALHACCGPCSLVPVRALREQGFEPTIIWANPNIQPVAEHDLRLATLRWWADEVAHVRVVEARCDRDAWERACAACGFDRARRCRACYALRLEEACRVAAELGFAYVGTTLAVSPYQLFDECGAELAARARAHGLEPVWQDFRARYPEATRESRELGMYRQGYCGCRFSAAEAAMGRHEARDARKRAKAAARAAAGAGAGAAAGARAAVGPTATS